MKKFLGILLIIAVVIPCCLAMFTGCEEPTDYEHTIIFYSSQGKTAVPITAAAIASFEAKYPGWKVKHIPQGGYDEVKKKIQTDFQGGNQPDLAYCYPDHVASYLRTGKVLDMTLLINSTEKVQGAEGKEYAVGYTAEEMDDFIDSYFKESYAYNYIDYKDCGFNDESILTIPFVKSTELMYYNKTALDKLELEPAKTWDELWLQCEAIRTEYPTATPLGYDSEANWFITMCEQNGWGYTSASEPHFLFNNPETLAWLNQLREYYLKGYITTKEDYDGAYTSALFTKGVEDGGVLYCIGSSGGASHQDPRDAFEWGIAPIPGSKLADGTINSVAISQGPSFVMFEAGHDVGNVDEKKKMTFLFMKELLDPTFQASFAIEQGYNPTRQSTYSNEAYKEHLEGTDITAVAANVAMGMINNIFTSPAFAKSSLARTQVGTALLYSIDGTMTPEQALADALSNCGGN